MYIINKKPIRTITDIPESYFKTAQDPYNGLS